MRARVLQAAVVSTLFLAAGSLPAEAGGWRCRAEAALRNAAGQLSHGGRMTAARAVHTATTLPDGRVLIAGGMERNGVFLDTAELYDPTAGEFVPAGRMSSRRTGHTATLLRDGRVLIAGGLAGRHQQEGRWVGDALATAETYDPATGEFAPTGSMSRPRSSHKATLLPDGRVLVIGGSDSGDSRGLDATADVYDPRIGRFTPVGSLTRARVPHATALLRGGQVLVAGGSGPGRSVLAAAEVFDPSTSRFVAVGRMAAPRHKHAATTLADGRVLITGGSDERDWSGQLVTAEIYDPARRAFEPAGKMAGPHFKHTSVLLRDGRVLVAGGSDRVEVYDPARGSFRAAGGRFDQARYFPAAALLGDGRVLITGGYGAASLSTDNAWVYRP